MRKVFPNHLGKNLLNLSQNFHFATLAALDSKTGIVEIAGIVRPWFLSVPENSDPIRSTCYGAKMWAG